MLTQILAFLTEMDARRWRTAAVTASRDFVVSLSVFISVGFSSSGSLS